MRAWLQAILDVVFPPSCLACGQPLAIRRLPLLCASCLEKIHPLSPPWCTCCGSPFAAGESHLCSRCLRGEFAFDLARSFFAYRGSLIDLLHRLKYQGRLSGLKTLGSLAGASPAIRDFSVPSLIIPVPLHASRLRQRGFNQSLLLARGLFPAQGASIRADLLQRRYPTVSQTTLQGAARRRNLRGAFSLARGQEVSGARILLVDDVFTTGATVHECAKTLKNGGCARVEVLTMARSVLSNMPGSQSF